MAKRKKNKLSAKHLYMAVILISGLFTGSFIIKDVGKIAEETDIQAEIDNTPAGKILTDFENLGKSGKEAQKELGIDKIDFGNNNNEYQDMLAEKHEATVVRVKDGDTYVLSIDGVENTVRLIGVDTPESVAPDTYSKENTEEGKEVSDIVKGKLLAGDKVFIEFDASQTDRYNRFLCYVYFADGTMVQDWLLSNGYARTMTIAPNVKYADHFKEVQHEAAENRVGLWNGFFEEE